MWEVALQAICKAAFLYSLSCHIQPNQIRSHLETRMCYLAHVAVTVQGWRTEQIKKRGFELSLFASQYKAGIREFGLRKSL